MKFKDEDIREFNRIVEGMKKVYLEEGRWPSVAIVVSEEYNKCLFYEEFLPDGTPNSKEEFIDFVKWVAYACGDLPVIWVAKGWSLVQNATSEELDAVKAGGKEIRECPSAKESIFVILSAPEGAMCFQAEVRDGKIINEVVVSDEKAGQAGGALHIYPRTVKGE